MAEQYCLRWNNHQRTLISVFDSLQERGCMVDCTLSAEGRSLQAHKVVLSACSPYLEDLLTKHYDKHPILILKDVKFEELKSMLDYMYRGEVNVAQDRLNTFLKAAESLQIKGLSDGGTDPPDSGGTPGATKRTSKGAPVSVRSEQLTVRTTNLNDNTSRDGSISPSLRKRRRRRGSDASDQESSSVEKQSSATPAAGPLASSDMLPTVPTSGPADASALLSIMENETEPTDSGISIASNQVPLQENVIREKDSETLIEPKSEFLDDDTAQDLPMEDDDMFRAGPSHGRSGNFGGDEDVYMAQDSGANAQEAAFDTVASSEAASLYEDDARTGCHSYSAGQASYDQQPPELPSRPGGSPRDTGDGGDHRCLACGVSFVSPPELMSHLRSHVKHSPEHKFTCQVCSEQFTRSIELARHRRTHTKEKLFNCDVCDKWFSSQRNLTRHKARHNPSDTQSCPVCHKVFSCMFTLKRHAKLHGGTRGSTSSDPMFKCHFCDQMFTAKTDLLSHFKVHRD